nr:hypothetical protein Iba_chr02eCG9260 [Ipomoea batatas]
MNLGTKTSMLVLLFSFVIATDISLVAEARNVARPCNPSNPCDAPCFCNGLNVCQCSAIPYKYGGNNEFVVKQQKFENLVTESVADRINSNI